MNVRSALAPLLAIGVLAGAASADAVIIAPRMVGPDGALAEGMAVLIDDDGMIRRVAPAKDLADHPRVRRLPDGAVLSPGLLDLASQVGVYRQNTAVVGAIDPDASVIDAFDPHAPDVRTALEAGVTTVMLVPAFNGLVDGASAAARTTPGPNGKADVIRNESALILGLGSPSFDANLGPTSRSGALQLLRGALDVAGENETSRLGRMLAGSLPAVARAEEPEDASAILRLLGRHDVVPTIANTIDAIDLADELSDYGAAAIVGPYGFGSSPRVLAGAGALEKAGVPVGFSAGLPGRGADRLRMTAALAVRHGMSAAGARRAMTSDAAALAGVASQVGAIAPKLSADLVIFSGDPLRLDSRVLEVWVRGRLVYRAVDPVVPDDVTGVSR